MQVGDLVRVKQTVGCHTPPRIIDRGVGVILEVSESEPINFMDMKDIDLGLEILVAFTSGRVELFSEQSVEVIS